MSRCAAGGPVTFTAGDIFPDVDLYGDGIMGSHGGSGLSALGGTIRVGELVPGAPAIRHALKLELDGNAYSNTGGSFRWPAQWADSCSPGCYTGTNSALKPGALLALKPGFAVGSLQTAPAKSIAWTLQNYGAYIVDNSGWSSFSFAVEDGPNGSVESEFQSSWGYAIDGDLPGGPWLQDLKLILANLYIIDNNGPSSIGGGGTPLQALAPALTAP
jgi:hypothetical protein